MRRRRIRTLGDGLGEILDGDVLRVAMTDGKPNQHPRSRITDDSGSEWGLHRPGFRVEFGGNVGDVLVRDGAMADRAEQNALYISDKKSELRRAPAAWWNNDDVGITGQGAHDLPSEPKEGVSCTINGQAGVWRRVKAPATFRSGSEFRMVCVPIGRSADSLSPYDLYDLQIADAWRSPSVPNVVTADAGAWRGNNNVMTGPNLQKELEEDDLMNLRRLKKQKRNARGQEEGSEEIAEDDDEDNEDFAEAFMEGAIGEAFNQTQTHTESSPPQRFDSLQRDLQREHLDRMRQLQPDLQQWNSFSGRVAEAQRQHQTKMDAEYSRYDQELQEAFRSR